MLHAVNFLLFHFSCEVFGVDQCQKSEAGVVILGSTTSDRSTAHLYSLGLLKRFSVVPRMKEESAPAPTPAEVQEALPGHQAQAISLLLSLGMET